MFTLSLSLRYRGLLFTSTGHDVERAPHNTRVTPEIDF